MARLGRHILIGLVCGLAAFALGLTPVFKYIELKGYDLFYYFKPVSHDSRIVIVAIDEPSFAQIGKQWPWPRSTHARLINALKKAGASAIGMDIIFAEPSVPGEDLALSEALKNAGNVVLASDKSVIANKEYTQVMAIDPIPIFQENAWTGLAKLPVDRDDVVRRFYQEQKGDEKLFSRQIADVYSKKDIKMPRGGLIYYAGPPDTFRTVSYYQALDPATYLPKNFFRGKIVLVGRKIQSSPDPQKKDPDYFATPYLFAGKGVLMSGVEIHANMLEDLLSGRAVTGASGSARFWLFVAAGIIAGIIQIAWMPLKRGRTAWRPVAGGLAACASFALYLALAYFIFFKYQLWIPTFGMAVSLLVPYGVIGADAYLQSEKKRKEIRKAFSHYLSPAILESVLANPEKLKLGGERVEATVLFSDIAGFTSISEKMRPEDVAAFLNEYLDEMTEQIFAYNGTVDKFVGDAVMAFWGAPLPDANHALNACRAALAMQKAAASLRERARQKGLPEIFMRVGVNAGGVIAGNMGSSKLFDYTVIGDTVNLASRLEGVNKEFGTSIIISRSVYELVKDKMETRPLGHVKVKGKAQEVEIYELTGKV